jgi:hypothetical protein
MCQGETLQEWQTRCIEELLDTPGVHLALLIIDDRSARERFLEKLGRLKLKNFIYYFYREFLMSPRACRARDLRSVFVGTDRIRCRTIKRGKFSEYFSDEVVDHVRKQQLDFVLRFGFGIIRGGMLEAPRYGVWSFHHGDEMKYRGTPPGFWEIYRGDPVTGAILQRLTDRLDGGIILKRGHFKTINFSYRHNLDQAYMESASWPAAVCKDLKNGAAEYVVGLPSQTKAPVLLAPTNLQTLKFFLRMSCNLLREALRGVFLVDQWNVGVANVPIHRFLEPDLRPDIDWCPIESNQFYADPFGLVVDGKRLILYEDFDYRSGKGKISWREFTSTGHFLDGEEAINGLPVHLSYPYAFEHDGHLYCVPESSHANGVSLYVYREDDRRWEKVRTIVEDFAGIDSTLTYFDGRWWMFCTDELRDSKNFLYIWYADALAGPWKPHLNNPVKTDIRSTRPGGKPFLHRGTLYRPTQDCSREYGSQVTINEVLELSPTRFRESPVTAVRPDESGPFPSGLHTLSGFGDVTLIDGRRWRATNVHTLLRLPRLAVRVLRTGK